MERERERQREEKNEDQGGLAGPGVDRQTTRLAAKDKKKFAPWSTATHCDTSDK